MSGSVLVIYFRVLQATRMFLRNLCLQIIIIIDKFTNNNMNFFKKIAQKIPHPFKFIQKKLDIQKQWVDFKSNLRPHKYKLAVGVLIISYPLYSSYVKRSINYGQNKIGSYLREKTQPNQHAFQWSQNFLKHLLEHVLTDPRIKQESMQFLFSIIKDQNFMNNLLSLLVSALQNPIFLQELKISIKDILIEQLKDVQVRQSINDFVVNLAQSQKVKQAFGTLIQDVFSSKQSVQTIVNLLKKGITNDEVKISLGQSVNFAVRQVLSDEQTLNQLKIFIFFLLRKFENDDEVKGMLDILFAKGIGLVKKKKEPELDKFLRDKKTDAV